MIELMQAGRAWLESARGRRRLAALTAVCDTFIPAISPPRNAPALGGFWLRTPSDLQVPLAAAGVIETRLKPDEHRGLLQLLDLLAVTGFGRLPAAAREGLLRSVINRENDLARGFRGLATITLGLFYGAQDDTGPNPNWAVMEYPGPPEITPPADRPLVTPHPVTSSTELSADVCVVGSGAGGGVIAGTLAQAGLEVVVVEAGGHYEEHTFPTNELDAYDRMYWRGTWALSDDDHVKIGAGATLGGGTTVNWTNCVMPPPWLRQEWSEHGLKDVDSSSFDEHLATVLERIDATEDCSDPNGSNGVMQDGADALGWSVRCVRRNTDASRYDPATAGHMGFGDRSGAKRGTLHTYLSDAVAGGSRILVNTRAVRVRTNRGRAAGVDAVTTLADGTTCDVRITAPTVVVAAGALETPAVLLRSGIGGPAVGHHLRLHPVVGVSGLYDEDQRAWWGAPHARLIDEFASPDGGFLIEGVQYGPAYMAGSLPWHGARFHKVLMSRLGRTASLIGLVRDQGGGRVTLDESGDSLVTYPLDDPRDVAALYRALEATARVHRAAGAKAVLDVAPAKLVLWRRGQEFDDFVARSATVPMRLPYRVVGSAHQMGSARMGTDPQTSVADPEGRLHDTPGVWIGDTSAFPTSAGVNPMLTCMALARRTAHAIAADVG